MGEQADRPARVAGVARQRPAEHPHLARARAHEAGEDPEQRALAGAVRPRHGERLAGRERQVDVAKNPKTAEGATETASRQQRRTVTGRRRSAHRARRGGMA